MQHAWRYTVGRTVLHVWQVAASTLLAYLLSQRNGHEQTDWEAEIYRTRAETIIARAAPDPYLWGPPSNLLGN